MPVIAYSEIMPELIVHNCITIPPVNLPIVYPNDTLDRLARIHQMPMTLIHAPAGYGKTVTTAHWSAQQPLPVAWVTLNTHNQQPQHVLRSIAAALKQASLMTQQSLDVGDDMGTGAPTNDALLALLNTIAVEHVLVIDNLHEIQSPHSWNMLHVLCDDLPHTTHLVLIGRCMPPFPMTEAYVRGRIQHINKTHLAFADADIAQFMTHINAPAYHTSEISRQSAGWGMATRYLAQHMHTTPQTPEHYQPLKDFIMEIVKDHPADIQRKLHISAGFLRMNSALLNAAFPDSDGEAFLMYLHAHQLFVDADAGTSEWHRYHRLFAMALNEISNPTVQAAHLRGAAWLEAHGWYDDALVIYNRYQYHAQMLTILEHRAHTYLQQGEFAQFLAIMTTIPVELFNQYPSVALAYAWALIMRGEYEHCHHVLHLLEAHAIHTSDEYIVVHTICQFYRTGVVDRSMFQQPEFIRLYAQYPFLHGLAALFTDNITTHSHTSVIRQPIADLYSSTRMLLRQGAYGRIHLYCQESLNNPPRHPLLAAIYGIWAEATYALNLNAQAHQLATEAHRLAQSLGNHHIRLVSATLYIHTLRMVQQHHAAQQLWADTYTETQQQHHMIPLGRVYILKELWRYALINHQLDDCQTIQQQLQPNIRVLDIPADVVSQLTVLQAYTEWCLQQTQSTDIVSIAVHALEQKWHATFVAAVLLLRHTSATIPHQLNTAYTELNPLINMPGIVRDWQDILAHASPPSSQSNHLQDVLTAREYEVFLLAVAGRTNMEIADQLAVSLSTVKTHLIHIYEKLNVKRRTDLVHLATQHQNQP